MSALAMTVEFGLFHHDVLLCRSKIRIEEHEKAEEFDCADTGGASSNKHLVVRHKFGLPAASLQLSFIDYAAGKIILEAGLAIGVHDSEEWESVALGEDYTFAFSCRQEVA
jgi:hypothetical protein